MGAEVEIKGVELAEIRAGISLLAGHRVVLVVNGVRGSRRYTRGDTSGGDGSGDDLEIVSEAGQRPVSQPAKSGSRALSLVLQDDEGTPRANLKFTLRAGSAVVEGTTGNGGELEATVPDDAAEGALTLRGANGDELYTLVIGGPPPPPAPKDDD